MTDETGKAPGTTALLIVDMINDFNFPEADDLLREAQATAEIIARLRDDADRAGMPVVYVNDNYGQWHSERDRIIDYCRERSPDTRAIPDRLPPATRTSSSSSRSSPASIPPISPCCCRSWESAGSS
jgi:nicotinamidase-related amidase